MLMPPGMTYIIGLAGAARSGKDTAAAILVEEFGAKRYAFADALKALAMEVDPWVGPVPLPDHLAPFYPRRLSEAVDALGWERAKEIPEVRSFLQRLGVGVRAAVRDATWIDVVLAAIARDNPAVAVISDVRFANELAVCDVSLRLVRTSAGLKGAAGAHVSEQPLQTDVIVPNDGAVEDLRAHLVGLFGHLARGI